MAITYTWKVTGIKKSDTSEVSDVVLNVRWEKIGTDEDGNEGKFSGATPFTPPSGDAFIPYDELTEDIVLTWVKNVVVDSYEVHVNAQIQKQINVAKNPITDVSSTDLPWSTN
jgi:hypothetical protein